MNQAHINKAKPNVIGMNICSMGTERVWKTFWLLHNVRNVMEGRLFEMHIQPGDIRE